MNIFELAVQAYICERPQRFIKPQFSIAHSENDGSGGSLPDFLVIDFEVKKIYLVEVTKADSLSGLMGRLAERETRWIQPLREYLASLQGGFETWPIHVTAFVRDENVKSARNRVGDTAGVSIKSLDEVIFDWRWNWNGGEAINSLE